MESTILHDANGHQNYLLPEFDEGNAVPANQHLIVHQGGGLLLDPGGHKVYAKVLAETMAKLRGGGKLENIFLSHQDPDIVAAINGWLMSTDAIAYAPSLWLRFIPHFGLDRLVADRLLPIPDEGMRLHLRGAELLFLPAHFLHSCGNFHVYDSVSKILYSGDLGSSIGAPYRDVRDFDEHEAYIRGFHERYMAGNLALRKWVAMVRKLDVETIAPQHGAMYRGKVLVGRFLHWAENLSCGLDLIPEFSIPA